MNRWLPKLKALLIRVWKSVRAWRVPEWVWRWLLDLLVALATNTS